MICIDGNSSSLKVDGGDGPDLIAPYSVLTGTVSVSIYGFDPAVDGIAIVDGPCFTNQPAVGNVTGGWDKSKSTCSVSMSNCGPMIADQTGGGGSGAGCKIVWTGKQGSSSRTFTFQLCGSSAYDTSAIIDGCTQLTSSDIAQP